MGKKLDQDEKDYVKGMYIWIAEADVTIRQTIHEITSHKLEIKDHKTHVSLLRKGLTIELRRQKRGMKEFEVWKKEHGLTK